MPTANEPASVPRGSGGRRDHYLAATLAQAMTDALRKRGVPDPAFGLWSGPANKQTLTDIAHQTLVGLRAAIATLG